MATGKDRIRGIWNGMQMRCNNPKRKDYPRYGGSGISVCDEWSGVGGFDRFYAWSVNNGYSDDLTIDRVDRADDYSPENCRWVTLSQQARNRSNNHLIEYKGEIKTLIEWAEIAGVRKDTFRRRIMNNGWSIEEAITTPNLNKKARLHHRNWRS